MRELNFTPGNKAHLRKLINYNAVALFYKNQNEIALNVTNVTEDCTCFKQKANTNNQGYNDTMQTENQRISQILTGTLGGRTTYGDFGIARKLSYLGGVEGQPGGIPRPLRNKF